MLKVAAKTFSVMEEKGAPGFNMTSSAVEHVEGPLKTTVILLEDGNYKACLICPHMLAHTRYLYSNFQKIASEATGLHPKNIFVFSSHNHSSATLSNEATKSFWGEGKKSGELTQFGKRFFKELSTTLRSIRDGLKPVTIEWAVGHENTIAYNRKGRRADGSTYFMREEDRVLMGKDFKGDVDDYAPVICFRAEDGKPVLFIVQYTAHPATAYHPEHPNVFGEYPQVACDRLSEYYSENQEVPVAFLQGCSGEINSKGLLTGDIQKAIQFGHRLGNAYIKASKAMQMSENNNFSFLRQNVAVPLKQLPSKKKLLAQKTELLDFIKRAKNGNEDTLDCIGLNFPKALTSLYRASLVKPPLDWTNWALIMHDSGKVNKLPKSIDMEISVFRLGDIGIVGMPCEPFIGIGRLIRKWSSLPLVIPCGYANLSYGYLPDSPNVGDLEYQSSFYLYTRFRPPYKKPGGNVLAKAGAALLKKL